MKDALISGSFEAIKLGIRQSKDGFVISLVVHPNDVDPKLAAAPIGTRLQILYTEIGSIDDDGIPDRLRAAGKSEKAKLQYASLSPEAKARVRSVRLCKEPEFQTWIAHHPVWGGKLNPSDIKPTVSEEGARGYLLQAIGVNSRSHIEHEATVRNDFLEIEDAYQAETGRKAEVR